MTLKEIAVSIGRSRVTLANDYDSSIIEDVESTPYVIIDRVAYPVKTQGTTPFNDATGVPVRKTPKLGCVCDGTYYYPGCSELRDKVGKSKSAWARSGLQVFNA